MPAPTQLAPAPPPPQDFNLRPPSEPSPAAPGQPGTAPTAAGGTTAATLPPGGGQSIDAAALPGQTGLSSTDAVIGGAILILLAVGIFFVRGAVRSHLIAGRASPSAAGSAGWALFALLLALSVLVLFGLLGNLWAVPAFTVPLSLFSLLMLVLFVLLYRAAARGRPARLRS